MADPADEKAPRLLYWLGVAVLVVVLLFAVFSLGVFVGERGLTRGVVPPWPAPIVTSLPTPTLPPIPTSAPPETGMGIEHMLAQSPLFSSSSPSVSSVVNFRLTE